MKILKYIYIAFFFFIFSSTLRSQQPEVLAINVLDNLKETSNTTMEFDLRVVRTSEIWQYWANGTFMFGFENPSIVINSNNYSIEYLDQTSELDLSPFPGQLPKDHYHLTPRIFNGRFSITVVGPESWRNANKVPFSDTLGLKIGRFKITRLDGGPIVPYMKWLAPYDYYQANAFKIDHDSVVASNYIYAYENDNIEMNNGVTTAVKFIVKETPIGETIITEFNAVYRGSKKVELNWKTEKEYRVAGYVIARGIRSTEMEDIKTINYTDTIADFRRTYPPNEACIANGTTFTPRSYIFLHDTVPYRGLQYCYELMYVDVDGVLHPKAAYDSLPVPNSVIVWAASSPNPFSIQTKVKYLLDDDVYLTAKVYDLQGKLVETLINNEFKKMGEHEVVFYAPAYSQQGLYDIIFVATPIDDPSVEISQAVVKTNLIK